MDFEFLDSGFSDLTSWVTIEPEVDWLSVDQKTNVRIEVFPGFRRVTVCNKPKWQMIKDKPADVARCASWDDELDELEPVGQQSGGTHLDPAQRAKRRLFDLIALTRWDWFVTLTLDPDKIDRKDVKAFSRKLKRYLDNLVQRKGIGYVLVPEEHKSGGYHAHMLIKGDIDVVDSGTVTWIGQKRPVKRESARKMQIPESMWQTVYNVPSWKLGYTTAVRTYGSGEELARYVGKYLTKDSEKIFGRRYWHSRNIKQRPDVILSACSYVDAKGVEYVNPYTMERYKIITIKYDVV